MARIIFGSLLCVTIFMSLSVLGHKGRKEKGGGGNREGGGKGAGGKCPDLGPGPVLPSCPWYNTKFVGPACEHLDKFPASNYWYCGYECNRKNGCAYWTFNKKKEQCALFASIASIALLPNATLPICGKESNPNYISGEKGCPIHPYTVQDTSPDDLCIPCGDCPCCLGMCLHGLGCACPIEGPTCCLLEGQNPSKPVTVEQAKISTAMKLSENKCEKVCDMKVGSKEDCYQCVAKSIADFDFYCIICLKTLLPIITSCLAKDPKDALACVLSSPVSDSCTSCLCDILCIIEPSLCKQCHDESHHWIGGGVGPALPPVDPCDPTWHYYPNANLCYKLFPETHSYSGSGLIKTQSEAKAACEKQGGCLVTIDTEGKQNFINKLVHLFYLYPNCRTDVNPTKCIWTSGSTTLEVPPPTGWPKIKTWQWDNCPTIEPLNKTDYINWGPGEPAFYPSHHAEGIQDIAIMFNQPHMTGNGNWNNFNPFQQLSYMCQKPARKPLKKSLK